MNHFMKNQQKAFADSVEATFEANPLRKKITQIVENVASPELLSIDTKLAAETEKPDCTSIGAGVIGLDKLKEALKENKDQQASDLTCLYNFALALGKTFTSAYTAGTASMQYQADGTRIFAQIGIEDLMISFQEPGDTFQSAVAKFEKLTDDDAELIESIPSLEIGVLHPGRGGE